MAIIPFPGNPQTLARRRLLATEIEAAREDLEAFGIHPSRIASLEELGRALAWVDVRRDTEALLERMNDPADIIDEALALRAAEWCR